MPGNPSQPSKDGISAPPPQRRLTYLFLAAGVLFGILVLGLRPKNSFTTNNVRLLHDEGVGIRFGQSGILYSDPLPDLPEGAAFSIDCAIRPERLSPDGFLFIFCIHDGSDAGQLLAGQWGSATILMNGDDYAHRKRRKRIVVRQATDAPEVQFLTISAGPDATQVFLDGRLVVASAAPVLRLPGGDQRRLVIGNSVYGRHAWRGDMFGFALYNRTTSPAQARKRYAEWTTAQHFSYAHAHHPLLLYTFDALAGGMAPDHGAADHPLYAPIEMQVLKPEIFPGDWRQLRFNRDLLGDTVVNFIGFFPFGFFLAAYLASGRKNSPHHPVLIAVAVGAGISLFLEVAQAWIPARNSDLRDLLMNTAGTLAGALIARQLKKKAAPPTPGVFSSL